MDERELMTMRLAAAHGALRLMAEPRTVHICSMCNVWSVLHDGLDLAGVEEAIRDHLDTDHEGWTMETLEASVYQGGTDA